MLNTIVGIFLVLTSFSVLAHPVIYKDGTMIGSFNTSFFSDNQLNHSFHQKWAVGLNHVRFSKDDKNTELGLGRLNHLLWRSNGEDSQANVYLVSGLGIADSEIENRRTNTAYLGGIETDWETRTLFVALKYYHYSSPNTFDVPMTVSRLGFSPLIADFDRLQTWFMLQGMHMGNVESEVVITPLVRFFYHNVLWEMGSSTRGDWLLNFMVHI